MLESAVFHQQEASTMLNDAYTPVRKGQHHQMEEPLMGENSLARNQKNTIGSGDDCVGSYIVSD